MNDIDKLFIQLVVYAYAYSNPKIEMIPLTVLMVIIGTAWAYFG